MERGTLLTFRYGPVFFNVESPFYGDHTDINLYLSAGVFEAIDPILPHFILSRVMFIRLFSYVCSSSLLMDWVMSKLPPPTIHLRNCWLLVPTLPLLPPDKPRQHLASPRARWKVELVTLRPRLLMVLRLLQLQRMKALRLLQ